MKIQNPCPLCWLLSSSVDLQQNETRHAFSIVTVVLGVPAAAAPVAGPLVLAGRGSLVVDQDASPATAGLVTILSARASAQNPRGEDEGGDVHTRALAAFLQIA